MYATSRPRQDITFAVHKHSRYTSKPSREHRKPIIIVLGFLKRTIELGLFYNCFSTVLEDMLMLVA